MGLPGEHAKGEDPRGPASRAGLAMEGVIGDERNRSLLAWLSVTGGSEPVRAGPAQEEADDAGGADDEREGDGEQGQGDERDDGHHDEDPVAEGSAADSDHRLGDDGEHGRCNPGEQRGDRNAVSPSGVDDRQCHDGHETGQHEQDPGDEPAGGAVEQPPQVDGELLSLGPGSRVQ